MEHTLHTNSFFWRPVAPFLRCNRIQGHSLLWWYHNLLVSSWTEKHPGVVNQFFSCPAMCRNNLLLLHSVYFIPLWSRLHQEDCDPEEPVVGLSSECWLSLGIKGHWASLCLLVSLNLCTLVKVSPAGLGSRRAHCWTVQWVLTKCQLFRALSQCLPILPNVTSCTQVHYFVW